MIDYDDGTRYAGWVWVESSNLGVVTVLPSEYPYQRVYVKAVAPGATTLPTPSTSQALTLNVRVVP